MLDFDVVFGSQNHEKLSKNDVEKHVFFDRRIFNVFFRIFSILARFSEAPGVPKIG